MNDSRTALGMAAAAAWVAALLFGVVAAFHAAIVFGAPWGEYTQGGGTSGALDTSGRTTAAASCVISVVMAAAILGRAGRGPLRKYHRVTTVLAWSTTVYAVVGVVLNLITQSAAERAVWAPVSIVILGLVAFVMIATHRKPVRQSSGGAAAHSGGADG